MAVPWPLAETERAYRDIIRRVNSNDRTLLDLSIGDLIRDERHAMALAEALRGNTQLRSVTFRDCARHGDHFEHILRSVEETQVSKIVSGAGEWAAVVGVFLVPASPLPLRRLDLHHCGLGPGGAVTLARALGDNRALAECHLGENEIGDEGAVALAGALRRRNRALMELTLDDNGVGARGQRALRDAVFDDASFGSLEESNHVLQSYFSCNPRSVFGRAHLGDVLSAHAANIRGRSAKTAVTKKLKRMLQRKYRVKLHVESFLETETNLLPHVLSWIGQRCDVQSMYELKPVLLNLLQPPAQHNVKAIFEKTEEKQDEFRT